MKKMKTVMFHSYKGGSGKTIFSTTIASILAKHYNKRVLLIEADFAMPSFQAMYNEIKPDLYLNDFLNSNDSNIENVIYPDVASNLGIIFCSENYNTKDKVHSSDQAWFLRKLDQLKKALKTLEYDYVLFDTSPGLHLFTINILTITNKIILLMRPDNISYRGINYLLNEIYARSIQLSKTKSFDMDIIINQVPVLDKFEAVLENWHNRLLTTYQFIDNVQNFYYNPELVYFTALEELNLNESNSFYEELKKYTDKQFT